MIFLKNFDIIYIESEGYRRISGSTGLGQSIDFMVMNSSQEADNIINKIDELAADGYVFTFDEVMAYCNKRQSEFMEEDILRMRRKVEQVCPSKNNTERR